MKHVFIVALLLALPSFAKPWNGIEPGVSTRDTVIQKFGEPSRTTTVGPVLYSLLVMGGSASVADEFLTSLQLVKPTKAP